MTEHELRTRLREVRVADEAVAQERAWAVIRAAHGAAQSREARPRWRATVPAVAGLAAVAILVVVIGSVPRQAVARWVRDALGLTALPQARPTLGPLPGGGQLLVSARSGVWLVTPRGGHHRLGAGEGATFSPHSLYVAAWRGHELAALDLRGRRQWSLTASAPVSGAQWSPDGYRIAYVAGRSLMVVAGDGSGAHRLMGRVQRLAPAWEPGTGAVHRVALLDARGAIELRDGDSGALIWTAHPRARPQQLLWSPDGRRLVVVSRRDVALYRRDGRRLASRMLAGGESLAGGALAPGDRLALLIARAAPATSSLALIAATPAGLRRAPRMLLTAAERLVGISWSPDHRWLLAVGPSADQWLFVGANGAPRIIAVSRVAAAFGASGRGRSAAAMPGAFPRVAGWQAFNPRAAGS